MGSHYDFTQNPVEKTEAVRPISPSTRTRLKECVFAQPNLSTARSNKTNLGDLPALSSKDRKPSPSHSKSPQTQTGIVVFFPNHLSKSSLMKMTPSLEIVNTAVEGAYDDAMTKKETSEHSRSSTDIRLGQDWDHITKPGQHDVLLGRGGGTNNHAGNIKFRKLVNEHKMRYLACSKVEKPKVAREVVLLWRKMEPPGRFLARKDETKKGPGSVKAADNVWFEVGDKKAREKASQCLRERTPDVLPYIKQLREQQDAITEQGVSMVQQQLQMQQDAVDMGYAGGNHNMPNNFPHPRRNSLPVPPQPGMYPQRRTSMTGMPNHNAQGPSFAPRRTSMPGAVVPQMAMSQQDFAWQQQHPQQAPGPQHPEDDFYGELTELEYQQNMMMMQQQMHRMQMQRMQQQRMRMQQQQMQRPQDGSGVGVPYTSNDMNAGMGQQQQPHHQQGGMMQQQQQRTMDNFDPVEPLPVQHDPMLTMSSTPVTPSPPHHSARSKSSGNQDMVHHHPHHQPQHSQQQQQLHSPAAEKRRPALRGAGTPAAAAPSSGDKRATPERTNSNSLMGLNSGYEDGELTLEEYRQQLEEYISSTQQVDHHGHGAGGTGAGAGATNLVGAAASQHHHLDGEDSDLEDDWEKEKERAHQRQQHDRKRGVARNASGTSFMSAKTTKSGMSLVSGISMFSDMMMSAGSAREGKMNMARSVSSNLSLMSELTDLSQNIDNLSIYDD